ncbi:OLC1v1011218C2 [Oldenlandia corymbosa var. corymbosa]|nr:OLC1v1011218C2 [Oldenlandia corymbosa var. corymbosa]
MVGKDQIFSFVKTPSLVIFGLCLATVTLLGGFRLRWPPNLVNFTIGRLGYYSTGGETCELFKGKWIWDEKRPPLYTNLTCKTLPDKKNCLLHGRTDSDYIRWRWKPAGCELPRFNPSKFLSIVRGKTLAFIGDSVGRNQMESLLCQLSTEESPNEVYKDAKDRFTTWQFPKHNFTLMVLWTRFLVNSSQTVVNSSVTGAFDLHLDKIDLNWAQNLPAVDIAIISDAQWFLRENYLYEGGELIGCIYCQDPKVTNLGPGFAIQRAFRAALNYINDCKDCSGILTLLRTYSPSHFENGTWKTGGSCLRTHPFGTEEIKDHVEDLDYRNIQVTEVETARKSGQKNGNAYGLLDVTEAMLMRPDGHPGLHWRRKKKGYSDCVHWCLPGPIDAWNELLLEVLRQHSPLPLRSKQHALRFN